MYHKAEQVQRKVYLTSKQSLGDEHPNTVESAEHLACSLAAQTKYAEAEKILGFVHATRTRVFGAEHRSTLSCTQRLAGLLSDMGETAQAAQMLRCVVDVQMRLLGRDHPDTQDSANNLVRALVRQAKKSKRGHSPRPSARRASVSKVRATQRRATMS
jgi:hypothetical protein